MNNFSTLNNANKVQPKLHLISAYQKKKHDNKKPIKAETHIF